MPRSFGMKMMIILWKRIKSSSHFAPGSCFNAVLAGLTGLMNSYTQVTGPLAPGPRPRSPILVPYGIFFWNLGPYGRVPWIPEIRIGPRDPHPFSYGRVSWILNLKISKIFVIIKKKAERRSADLKTLKIFGIIKL